MASVVPQEPFNEYTGNGVATVYPYEFQLLDAGDLVVTIDGVLVPSSDYTLSGVGVQAGGDVTFDTAPADDAIVLLSREIALERQADYQYNGDLREETLDLDFNRLWQALQGQQAKLGGALRLPYPEQADDLPSVDERKGKALVFDPITGAPTVLAPADGTAAALALALADSTSAFNGDGMVAHKRTITSSIASTLHEWHERQPYQIDVEGGCIGDDSTDNSSRITTIFTALALLSATALPSVCVGHGVYQHGGIDAFTGVTIFGFGHGSVLKAKASIGRGLIQSANTTTGSHRITIRNLCVDGNKANQPNSFSGYSSHGINLDGPCENWVIEGVKVFDTKGHGTHLRGGGPTSTTTCVNGVRITGCWYKDAGNYDVGATNGRESVYANQATNLIITNCLMEGSGRQTIALEGSTTNPAIATRYTIVSNCILRNALSGGGIDDEANGGGDHVFIGNVIYGMTGTGIRTAGDTGRKILGLNIIFDVDSRGIDAESEAGFAGASLHIYGCIVDTTGTEAIKVVGCWLATVEGVTIINAGTIALYMRNQVATELGMKVLNVSIYGSGQEGIVIDRPSIAPHVIGCTVVNAGSAAFPSAGISIRGNTGFIESPKIKDNTVIENRGTPYTTYAYSFSQTNKAIVEGNGVHGTTATNDVQWSGTASTNVRLGVNGWDQARVTGAPGSYADGYVGSMYFLGRTGNASQTLTYSASMTIDATLGNHFTVTVSNTSAFTMNNPTGLLDGQEIQVTFRNTGGVMGARTWGGLFKMSGNDITAPANGNSRTIRWRYNGTNLIELWRTPADVPN